LQYQLAKADILMNVFRQIDILIWSFHRLK
jgi:hypothetical protein